MADQPTPKLCTHCGCDCAKIERFKDREGRYYCAPCHKLHGPARVAAAKAPVAAAAIGADAPFDAIEPALAREDLSTLIALEESAEPVRPVSIRVCSNCGRMLGQAIICTGCGYNSETGKMLHTAKKPAIRSCTRCGYSLEGIEAAICPECGFANRPKDTRDRYREESKTVVRRAYLVPLGMMIAGLTITSMLYANFGVGGSDIVAYYLIRYAFSVPSGVLAFFLACLMWLGFDAPMHLTALRLAAIYAIVDMVDAIFLAMGLQIYVLTYSIQFVVYIALLSQMLDLDFADVIFLSIIMIVIRIAVFVGIAFMLYEMGYI